MITNQTLVSTEERFKNPPSIYRGTPFWAWNCKINEIDLEKQIDYFNEMGMGGFHIHCRTGMNTPYLSDEFMDYVKKCNEIAKEKNMLCWLYDEDRYASGYGGGYVTKHYEYRERSLVFAPDKPSEDYLPNKTEFDQALSRGEIPRGYILASYQITLMEDLLAGYKRLEGFENSEIFESNDNIWWAYVEIDETSSWWNNQTYVDTLNKKAIDEFIYVTHDKYYEVLGKEFSQSIPAIFTDEPQFIKIEHLNFATEKRRICLPFTDDLPDTYYNTYGVSLMDILPEIIWQPSDNQISLNRYRFINHVTDRFVEAYAKNIGSWCENHNIALSGHMKAEENLESQTEYVGEVMRSLRHFHIPGHDVLCDQRDYATAKQAQSVAHQYGRIGAMSELYGVTNWDFDFRGHKMSGDWQAALGITVRVHHLAWMSMKGEAKRDYPASIFYQSPWYKEYHIIEDYFARINTALTRGKAQVRIGVIHPIESYWLHYGPTEQTYLLRQKLENNYSNIIHWLLFNLLDFDFISEALLEEQHMENKASYMVKENKPYFLMGEMLYNVIIVPECHTLRNNTVERILEFKAMGGNVIFLGDAPYCMNGMITDQAKKVAQLCITLPFDKNYLLKELEEVRDLDIRYTNGERTDNLVYQLRADGEQQWLFIAHAYEKLRSSFYDMVDSTDYRYIEPITLHIKGNWNITEYHTMTGLISPLKTQYEKDTTILQYDLSIHDSLLLQLKANSMADYDSVSPNSNNASNNQNSLSQLIGQRNTSRDIKVPVPYAVTFEEPNVFLLDNARYRLDNEEWREEEDILKLDNINRKRLGYPPKEEAGAQPWTYSVDTLKSNKLSLRFEVESEIEVKAELAVENYEDMDIYINGQKLKQITPTGWYVDEAIKRLPIPMLKEGMNELILEIPYGLTSNIEPCYLLGDFGVSVAGKHKKIVKAPEKIYFGDITKQGYPFYGGNLKYQCKINTPEGNMVLKAQYFNNPLLSVEVDNKKIGNIAFAPYTIDLGHIAEGQHDLSITAYGNRYNTFGQLHNCDKKYTWFGSCSWRTTGDRWSEEYQLKENGILSTPVIINN